MLVASQLPSYPVGVWSWMSIHLILQYEYIFRRILYVVEQLAWTWWKTFSTVSFLLLFAAVIFIVVPYRGAVILYNLVNPRLFFCVWGIHPASLSLSISSPLLTLSDGRTSHSFPFMKCNSTEIRNQNYIRWQFWLETSNKPLGFWDCSSAHVFM